MSALCLRPLAEPLYSVEEKRLMRAKEQEMAIEVRSRPIPRWRDAESTLLAEIITPMMNNDSYFLE